MCEVSEKIYAEGWAEGRTEGRTEGELNAKKLAAYNMRKKDYPPYTIAELLEVSIPTVEQWLNSRSKAAEQN